MPKKTRREKLAAEKRRAISFNSVPSVPVTPVYRHPQPPPEAHLVSVSSEFWAIRGDLIKTIVLSGTAMAIEVLIAQYVK